MPKSSLSNPFLSKLNTTTNSGKKATYSGISLKIVYFLILTFVGIWLHINNPFPQYEKHILVASGLIAIISPFIINFFPSTTIVFGTLYALAQGVVIAFLSGYLESKYPGILEMALIITLVTFLVLLFLYSTGIVKVGKKVKTIIMTLVLGSILMSGIIFISSFFTPALVKVFYGYGPIAIIVSAIGVIIAALGLLVSFDNITMVVNRGMSKKYEWQVSFGLIMSMILLFIRILDLLSRIMQNSEKKR